MVGEDSGIQFMGLESKSAGSYGFRANAISVDPSPMASLSLSSRSPTKARTGQLTFRELIKRISPRLARQVTE